jgi:predicted ABC-type ATPase
MGNKVKRLRIFAGLNGSGKSTLYDYLVKIKAFNSYFHINPDSMPEWFDKYILQKMKG